MGNIDCTAVENMSNSLFGHEKHTVLENKFAVNICNKHQLIEIYDSYTQHKVLTIAADQTQLTQEFDVKERAFCLYVSCCSNYNVVSSSSNSNTTCRAAAAAPTVPFYSTRP
jgi:hypothetical protein